MTDDCGTVAAYWRHRRAGERIDEKCRLAINENNSRNKRARNVAITRLIAENPRRYRELLAGEHANERDLGAS